MPKFRIKITKYIHTAEEAFVTVEAESKEDALDVAEEKYVEGEYEGVPDVEWEEDADAYDAYDHEMEIVEE